MKADELLAYFVAISAGLFIVVLTLWVCAETLLTGGWQL
jgi:hypothetical protein